MNENAIEEATLNTLSQMLASALIQQMATSDLESILFGIENKDAAKSESARDGNNPENAMISQSA